MTQDTSEAFNDLQPLDYAFPWVVYDKMCPGMTLRDWFAGQAIQAVITAASAGQHHVLRDGRGVVDGMVFDAYEIADAMLAERSKSSDSQGDNL